MEPHVGVDNAADLIVILGLLLFYSYQRFNLPAKNQYLVANRYSTTFLRFHTFFFIYYLFNLGALFVLWYLISQVNLDQFAALDVFGSMQAILGKSPLIGATLALTTLLPTLPFLSKVDQFILNFVWENGHIPNHLRGQVDQLKNNHIAISPRHQEMLRDLATSCNIPIQDGDFKEYDTLLYEWMKTAVLKHQLVEWRKDWKSGRYFRFFAEHRNVDDLLEKLEDDFHLASKKVASFFQEQKNRVLIQLESELTQGLKVLQGDYADFIVQLICKYELTRNSRIRKYRELGYEDSAYTADCLSLRQVSGFVAMVVGIYVAISFVDNFYREAPLPFSKLIYLGLGMAMTYNISVMMALAYRNSRIVGYDKPSFWGVLQVSFLVFLATNFSVFLLRILFQPFGGHYTGIDIPEAWVQMQWSFPYQIQCMGLAFVLLYFSGIVNLKTVLNASKDQRPFYRSVGIWALVVTLSILSVVYMKDADRRAQYLNDWLFLSDFLRSFLAGALILWLVPQELGRNIGTSPAQLFEHFLRTRREDLIEELKTMNLGETEKCFVAVGYAISHADGAMHAAEVSIIKSLLWKLESLEFADFSYPKAKEYLSNPNLAWAHDQARLLQDMAPLVNKPLLTDLLMLFAEAVSRADSNVSESEKQLLDAIYAHMKADEQEDSDELLWLRSCGTA